MRAMILLTGLFLTPVAVQAADWKSFSNDRYGFSVDVPASFKASAPPDNNDGLTFNSPDGRAEIRAYGHLLSDGENLVDDERETERYSAEDHLHVTYRQATARNFTMSGLKGASCNADSTNRSNIKLEAHRLKCVASHCDVSGPAIKRAISAKIDRDAASFASGELVARFMASRPPVDAAPPRRPCAQRRASDRQCV